MTYEVKSLIYELTERCDLSCRYCYNYWLDGLEKRDAKKLPSKENWLEITDKLLDELDVDKVVLSGGEPLKLDFLSDLCEYLDSKGVDIDLLTGAQGLTEERVKRLVDSGVNLFEISLLSYEKEEHNSLVDGQNFENTIRAMKLAKKYGAKLCTTIIGMKDNIEKVVKTAELAVSLGTDSIMFNRVNLGGRSVGDVELYPDRESLLEVLNELNDLSSHFGTRVHCGVPIPPCIADPDDYPRIFFGRCPAGVDRSYFTVESNGDVRTCNHSPLKLINVFEDDFEEIFETEVWEDFVDTFPERCESCVHLDDCKSSCRAAGYVEKGEWGSLDPFVKNLLSS